MSSFKLINIKKNHGGFSLVEIMVAILIISTTFIGLMSAFPLALKIAKNAENRTQASYFAQEKIEELFRLNYSNIATGTIEVKHSLGLSSPRSAFQRETTVNYVDQNLNNTTSDLGLKKIVCRVYYPYALTKNETYLELTTLISRK